MFWFIEAKSAMAWLQAVPDRSSGAWDGSFVVDNRGKQMGDLLWTGGNAAKLASSALIETLHDVGATGWTSTPADIRFRDGEPLEGFSLLEVTGTCGNFRQQYDRATVREFYGDTVASGVDVSIDWDGSDLFYTAGVNVPKFLATDRVVKAFARAGLRGWEKTLSTKQEIRVQEGWPPNEL